MRRTAAAVSGPKRPSAPGGPSPNPRRSRIRWIRRTAVLGVDPRPAPCSRTGVVFGGAAAAVGGAPSATAATAIRTIAALARNASSQDGMTGLPFESARYALGRDARSGSVRRREGAQPGRSAREMKRGGRDPAGGRRRRYVAQSASARKTTSSAPGPPADPPPKPLAPAAEPTPAPPGAAGGAGRAGWPAPGARGVDEAGAAVVRAVDGALKAGRPMLGETGAHAGAGVDAGRSAGSRVVADGAAE